MGTARGEAAAASSGLELVAEGEAGRVEVGDAVPVREDEPVGVEAREVAEAPVVAVAGTSGCVVAASGRPVGADGDADPVAVDRGAVAVGVAARVAVEPGTCPGVDGLAVRGVVVPAVGVDPPREAGAPELRGEDDFDGVVTRGVAEVALLGPASVGEAVRGVGACDAPALAVAGAGGRISTGRVTAVVGELDADAVGEAGRVAPVVDDAVVAAVFGEAEREVGLVAGDCAAAGAAPDAGEDARLEPLPPGVAGRIAVAVGDAALLCADELGDGEGSG